MFLAAPPEPSLFPGKSKLVPAGTFGGPPAF